MLDSQRERSFYATILLLGAVLLFTGAVAGFMLPSLSDSTEPEPTASETAVADQADTFPSITPAVNYTVVSLNTSAQTATIQLSYAFNTSLRAGSVSLPTELDDTAYTIVKTTQLKSDVNTVNITEPTDTITFTYRVSLEKTDSVTLQYIGTDETVLRRPDITGTVTVGATTYRLSPPTISQQAMQTPNRLGQNSFGDTYLYSSPTGIVTDTTLFISNSETLLSRSLTETDGYANISLVQGERAVKNWSDRVTTAVSHIDTRLGDTVNNNQLTVITYPGLGLDYHGGLFANSPHSPTTVIDTYQLVKDRSITLTHELVHAYQNYTVSEQMQWWTEGSAEYIGGVVANTTGKPHEPVHSGTFDSMWAKLPPNTAENGSLTGDLAHMRLTAPETWETTVQYRRGAAVVSQIDRAIRAQTSDKTIYTVLRWMNTYDGVVTLDAFLEYIEELTSPTFRAQVEDYLTGTDQVKPVETLPAE